MSAEEFREDVERALKRAAADDVDPDDLEDVLGDMSDRIERMRVLEGDAS